MMMMVEDEGIFRWLDYERRKGFIGSGNHVIRVSHCLASQ